MLQVCHWSLLSSLFWVAIIVIGEDPVSVWPLTTFDFFSEKAWFAGLITESVVLVQYLNCNMITLTGAL